MIEKPLSQPPEMYADYQSQPQALERARVGRFRFVLVGVLFVIAIISAADRVLPSLLLADQEFLRVTGIEQDHTAQGALMSVFVLAYGLGNIPFGFVSDWIGTRRAMLCAVALWAGLAALMGSGSSYGLMLMGRGLRGAAEGPALPAMNGLMKTWFPPRERGRANAIWITGFSFGMAGAVPLLAYVISMFGWRGCFFAIAAAAVVIGLPLAYFLIHNRPAESRWVGAPEADYVRRGADEIAASTGRWQDAAIFIKDYHYWLVVAYHAASLAMFWGLATWIPKYLIEARGFPLAESGLLASFPYLLSGIVTLIAGSIGDS